MIKEVRTGIKKLSAGFTLFSLEIILLVIIFGGALVTFILLARMIFSENKSGFDVEAFTFLSGFINDTDTSLMRFFTFLGSHKFLIPANILLVAWFFLMKKPRWYSLKIPVISLSSLLLMFSLKYIFHRARPLTPLLQEARGYSFPSGHALMSFTFYGLLIYLVWLNVKNTWLKWLCVITLALLIFAIGLSRVYLRVHYASDVIAGYCIGCMWLLLSIPILNQVEKISIKKIDPVVREDDKARG